MKTLELKNVTLCAVACTKIPDTIYALKKSMRGIHYARVILITHEDLDLTAEGIEVLKIEKLDYKGYNHFILYRLKEYIQTDFTLVVQNDGYILRPYKWKAEFLNYDYIGAPWRKNKHFTKSGVNVRVGNGGFSLRSKKLLHSVSDLNIPFSDYGTGFWHEDGMLSVHCREELETFGIRFAPVEIAAQFSHEFDCPESVKNPFGFHKYKYTSFFYPLRIFFLKFRKLLKI
jgi:hypothetical protein